MCGPGQLGTHLPVDTRWAGMGWYWCFHHPSGSRCHPDLRAAQNCPLREDRGSYPAQKNRRHQEGAEKVERSVSWVLGGFCLSGQEALSRKEARRFFYYMHLNEFHGSLST